MDECRQLRPRAVRVADAGLRVPQPDVGLEREHGADRNVVAEFRDDVSFTPAATPEGRRRVRSGDRGEDLTGSSLGTWTFGTDQFFDPSNPATLANLTNPIQFSASFPPVVRQNLPHVVPGYVQDDWRSVSNLTLNLGLRYDLQTRSFNQNLDTISVSAAAFLSSIRRPAATTTTCAARRRRLGCQGQRTLGRARGLRPLQPLPWNGVSNTEHVRLWQTNITIREPVISRIRIGGRDPLTFVVHGAAEHHHRRQRHRNPRREHRQRSASPAS